MEILRGKGPFEETMAILLEKIAGHLEHRTGGSIQTEAVVFSNKFGILGKTPGADSLLSRLQQENGREPQ